ncbi:gastrula zinc finger protein XlCGF52.1, partial [Austrofundulus limnaeus]|uniref:Gastrula zinc finger protein XlCGF52.1 n=1 Tax=Austrofundulus limnaeus TaxID=52670 RepID=A0A2I4D8W6_AUSLI
MPEPDVQQVFIKEEEPDEWSSSLHHQDPKLHIKEEEEELLASPGGGITSFPFALVTLKSEKDEEEHLSSSIYQNKIEDCEDEKPSTSRSTKQREDVKVNNPDLKLVTARKAGVLNSDNANYEDWQIPLSEYGPENESNKGCFKEIKVPDANNEVEGNNAKQSLTCPKHTTDHSDKSSTSCLCNKKGPTLKLNMDSEMEAHIGEKLFDHEVCDKIFNQERPPNIDTKDHTEEAPFDCDVCGKAFTVKGSLNRHMRIHTGEKHFSCDFCGKKFGQKAHINRHMIIHKGDKPFVCDVCGKTFNAKANLNVHKRIHTGEKQFGCDVCGKTFNAKANLNVHKRIHTGEK